MATEAKVIVSIANDAIGESNPAQVSFDFSSQLNPDQLVARCISYLALAGQAVWAQGTRIIGARIRLNGDAGSVDWPFPVLEYASDKASFAGLGKTIPTMTAYGVVLGGGALAPIGTSVCVSEQTATASRKGRGRHYMPFVASTAVDGVGQYKSNLADALAESVSVAFLVNDLVGRSIVGWSVKGKVSDPYLQIVGVKPRRILSNLNSRRK